MEKCTWRDALVSRVIEVESSRDSISERCDKDDKLKLFEFKESQQPKNVHSLMVKIEGNPDLFPSLELGELGELGELDELCADSLKDNIRADALEELLAKWPSKQLAEWVSNGILSEEDDENTKAWLDNTVKVCKERCVDTK
ncbi:Uncharacterised protein [Escherichia coli]|uniref:Uncharacterized protein n=1 Tax=Escherichia coli TaxID=562 RepID=A0A376TM62_ECOLX|nr:Uncharacterised protein [Escherichia coli]